MSEKKNGRPAKYLKDSNGDTVNGLSKRTDGRYRIATTGQLFSAPNDAEAIRIYHERKAKAGSKFVALPGPDGEDENWGAGVQLIHKIDEAELYAWAAKEIRLRPKLFAQRTGIEQIGYLTNLRPPLPVPTAKEIENAWTNTSTVQTKQKTKVTGAWNDFINTIGINSIDDITLELVVKFKDVIHRRDIKGKTQQHLFTNIRRILRFAKERAMNPEVIDQVLSSLSILKPSKNTVTIDPHPIAKDDFTALLKAAIGDDRAMLLLTLNAALHPQEMVDMKWSDIKGTNLIARREKTGNMLRIATLWPETIAALNDVKKIGDNIFYSDQTKAPLTVSGAAKRYRKLRKDAKVSESVKFDDLRDGAATAALGANVNDDLSALLLGHRSGISDRYAMRKAEMVKPACDAVYAYYFGKQ